MVGGDLTLDGTLNVTDAGGFGAGLYRLIDYGGTLTDNGLDIGTAPTGYDSTNLTVQTATVGQINLLVDAALTYFWDGSQHQRQRCRRWRHGHLGCEPPPTGRSRTAASTMSTIRPTC